MKYILIFTLALLIGTAFFSMSARADQATLIIEPPGRMVDVGQSYGFSASYDPDGTGPEPAVDETGGSTWTLLSSSGTLSNIATLEYVSSIKAEKVTCTQAGDAILKAVFGTISAEAQLSCNAVAVSGMRWDPQSLDFGSLQLGQTSDKSATLIVGTSYQAGTITSNNSAFSIVGGDSGYNLYPYSSSAQKTFTIRFSASSAGLVQGRITAADAVLAVSGNGQAPPPPASSQSGANPTSSASGAGAQQTSSDCKDPTKEICNPLKAQSLTDLINTIIDFVFTISLVVAPMMVIYAGIIFVTGGGNPMKLIQARNILIWTGIGFIIILIAESTPALIRNILGS